MRIEEKPRLQVAPFDAAGWRELLAKWAHAWDVDGLDREVRIVVSRRMRVTLGVYAYREREIRIAAFLLDAPPLFLQEVVCHEFAHAAIHAREAKSRDDGHGDHEDHEDHDGHGVKRAAPHGSAWRLLMRQAGWIPRARIPRGELDRLLPINASTRVMWRHRCPKCRAERLAGRPVRQWRCGNCSWFGIGGRLEIERLDASA